MRKSLAVCAGLCFVIQFVLFFALSASSHFDTSVNTDLLSFKPIYKTSDVTVALCHPTLHGQYLDLKLIVQFIKYYRHLGFDHLFFWYESYIRENPLFDFINKLPYVTFTELEQTKNISKDDKKYHHQRNVQKACLGEFAQNFDWALVVDADEYLWFSENMDIKEFLSQNDNLTYISFGKWMYTTRHQDATANDTQLLFGLRAYPYTPKAYCRYSSRREIRHGCPTWQGRCKVMVRPKYHVDLEGVHGKPESIKNGTSKHFDKDKVHLKEWCGLLGSTNRNNVRSSTTIPHSDRKNFNVNSSRGVNTHDLMDAHRWNDDGSVTIYYDDQLEGWLRFVSKLDPYDHDFIEKRRILRHVQQNEATVTLP